MTDYQLYCFAESGNSYKCALMLALSGLSWDPILVDFFNGEKRSEAYRTDVNEMGEVPVLVDGPIKLSQSGIILHYLAEKSGKFGGKGTDQQREVWRWILFDNHKLTSYTATLRFLIRFAKSGEPDVLAFLEARAKAALGVIDKHLARQAFIAGDEPTLADLSLCGYLYFDDELGFPLSPYTEVNAWLSRIKSLPGWQHRYDLMPSVRPPG